MRIGKTGKERLKLLAVGLIGLGLGYFDKDTINLVIAGIRPPATSLGERWYKAGA